MQSIDSIGRNAYGTRKDLASEKEEIKCNNIIKQKSNLLRNDVKKENIKEYNPNWPHVPDHPYRILIIEGSGSGKINLLFSLISQQPDIGKIYLYAKDTYEAKYQFLINKQESTRLRYLNDSKAFTEYSNDKDDIYKKLKNRIQIKNVNFNFFEDLIADMLSNKKLNPIVTELFIRGRTPNISLVFSTKSYFAAPKNIRLNTTHYFIMNFPKKLELQQIATSIRY